MRVIAVKIGRDWRLYQSNDRVKGREGRYTLLQWLREGGRWSRVLGEEEADEWWGKLEPGAQRREGHVGGDVLQRTAGQVRRRRATGQVQGQRVPVHRR